MCSKRRTDKRNNARSQKGTRINEWKRANNKSVLYSRYGGIIEDYFVVRSESSEGGTIPPRYYTDIGKIEMITNNKRTYLGIDYMLMRRHSIL